MQTHNLELISFLQHLRPRYKLATLSNDWLGAREQQNRLFQLEDMLGVNVMLSSYEEGLQKPEPDFYLPACQRLGVQPEEVVFIDDREQCVVHSWGCSTIVFCHSPYGKRFAAVRVGKPPGPRFHLAPLADPLVAFTIRAWSRRTLW